MAVPMIADYGEILRAVRKAPNGFLWSSYDDEADVLYVNFQKPAPQSLDRRHRSIQ